MVPVRCIRGGLHICGFCDTSYHGGCIHTRLLQKYSFENGEGNSNVGEAPATGDEENDIFGSPFVTKSVSHLRLAPASCSRAIQMDITACKYASLGQPFVVRSPTHCPSCHSPRNEDSMKLWKDGVLMCTRGPCPLHIEEYLCTNLECTTKIVSEGREHFVLLLNLCTAATHALLRRELIGVVLGNDTLNGRLRHFHSQVQANINTGYFSSRSSVPCRSVRILQDMCVLMLKLTTLDLDKTLFSCETCESSTAPIPVLCIDGIQLGYLKNKQMKLKNISQKCEPLRRSMARSMESTYRPLTGLLRKEAVFKIFLAVLKGKDIACTRLNVREFVMCIRLINGNILPPEFCADSICGSTPNNISHDIGDECHLSSLRRLINSLSDESALLYRFMKLLNEFISQLSQEAIESFENLGLGAQHSSIKILLEASLEDLRHRNAVEKSGIPWGPWVSLTPERERDIKNELLNMFVMFAQGSVCQFIRRSDLESVKRLRQICLEQNIQRSVDVIRHPDTLAQTGEETSLLSSSRIVQAGLLSVLQIDIHDVFSNSTDTMSSLSEEVQHLNMQRSGRILIKVFLSGS
ncbi:hypothetical protein FGB62_99g10 [Gracilaria domingensis]|nr:hypothetical protein FGB62_99g10 [Gracilaria domingensis]